MGSVSSTSPNLSTLLQNLSVESPQLSSMLSTPEMQSALQKASPGDLAQLSDQALQLQQVGLLFGNSGSTASTGASDSNSLFSVLSPGSSAAGPEQILEALDSSLGVAAPNGATPNSTSSNQVASSVSGFQAQELNALFGATQTVDPLLNTLG
jgi:hypothetical protein